MIEPKLANIDKKKKKRVKTQALMGLRTRDS